MIDSPPNGQLQSKTASKLRFESLNAFIDFGLAEAKLTPATALVWLILYRFASARDGTVTVSTERIGECGGLSKSTVLRAMADLKKKKMVKVLARGGINRGASKYLIRAYSPKQIGNP